MTNIIQYCNVCVLCGVEDDPTSFHHTENGAGPICMACWNDLTDPDEALKTQAELDIAEQKIDELERESQRLANE